jgi:hypothetical protein
MHGTHRAHTFPANLCGKYDENPKNMMVMKMMLV